MPPLPPTDRVGQGTVRQGLATARSSFPPPLRSPTTTDAAPTPASGEEAAVKLPVPSPNRIETFPSDWQVASFPQLFATAKSSFPSPLKSPTAIERELIPTCSVGPALKFPVPSPSRMDTLPCELQGGNSAVQQFVPEWTADHPDCRVIFHNWWNAPATWAKVQAIDPVASHGSWMENFPWTRLPDVQMPTMQAPMVDLARVRALDPVELREYIGDGNYGGVYQKSDDDMLALWKVAVEETRALLEGTWGG